MRQRPTQKRLPFTPLIATILLHLLCMLAKVVLRKAWWWGVLDGVMVVEGGVVALRKALTALQSVSQHTLYHYALITSVLIQAVFGCTLIYDLFQPETPLPGNGLLLAGTLVLLYGELVVIRLNARLRFITEQLSKRDSNSDSETIE